jgi:CheY-like chemotaxis protein
LLISRIRIIILDVGTASEKTVLIVDNQPRETAVLQKQLAFAGFKTEIATTGAGAIKIVEEHPPDLVLIEASLSDIDSVEVVAFIRSDLRTCRVPVLAMSVLPHLKGRCLKGGCDDFLQKPIKTSISLLESERRLGSQYYLWKSDRGQNPRLMSRGQVSLERRYVGPGV